MLTNGSNRTPWRVWAGALAVLTVVGVASGSGAFLAMRSLHGPSREGAPASIPALPVHMGNSDPSRVYSRELARLYEGTDEPSEEMVREFYDLMAMIKRGYSRSTDMQIRDAIKEVAALSRYGRPDLDLLASARLLVEAAPSAAGIVSQRRETPHPPDGSLAAEAAEVRADTVTFLESDLSISEAIVSITEKIRKAYEEALEAREEAERARAEAEARVARVTVKQVYSTFATLRVSQGGRLEDRPFLPE